MERQMKVIGAGFGRTGTFSLRSALHTLGFDPCYHMVEVGQNPSHAPVWAEAARGNPPDWREFLRDYQATMDWPGCLFWKELAEAFPEAKIVLNTREAERWYDSVQNTFLAGGPPPGAPDPNAPENGAKADSAKADNASEGASDGTSDGEHGDSTGPPPEAFDMITAVMWRQFGGFEQIADKQVAIDAFEAHYAEVQATIPADRLLVYEVKQGWEPLCEFLDVPVPDEPFPRLNDRANFRSVLQTYMQHSTD